MDQEEQLLSERLAAVTAVVWRGCCLAMQWNMHRAAVQHALCCSTMCIVLRYKLSLMQPSPPLYNLQRHAWICRGAGKDANSTRQCAMPNVFLSGYRLVSLFHGLQQDLHPIL